MNGQFPIAMLNKKRVDLHLYGISWPAMSDDTGQRVIRATLRRFCRCFFTGLRHTLLGALVGFSRFLGNFGGQLEIFPRQLDVGKIRISGKNF